MSCFLLLDNGSLRADATKRLRQLAHDLSLKSGQKIHPVSLQHADKISVVELDDQAAQILTSFIRQRLALGDHHFIILPLFFGESRALTSFVVSEVESLIEEFADLRVDIADVLYPLPEGEPRLVDIVYDNILVAAKQKNYPLKNIIVVDHGSPVARVTAVRKHIVEQLQQRFSTQIDQAVMERREGAEYDFNGALLEDCLLKKAISGETTAIVSLLFLLAGRHAGKGGDITEICERVMRKYPSFHIVISPLVSEHETLISILYERLKNFNQLYCTKMMQK